MVLGGVTGNDAQQERFGEIDAEDRRIVMRVAVHGLSVDLDVIESGYRHAFEEVFDVTVPALTCVGVRLFIQTEVFVIERSLVRSGELFVLDEVTVEVPGLREHLPPT